jgi:integrase
MPRVSKSGIDGVQLSHDAARDEWIVGVRDDLGRLVRHRAPTEAKAKSWAVAKLKEFARGGTAGTVRMSDLGAAFLKRLRSQDERPNGTPVNETYANHVELVYLAMVRDGLDNLRDPAFGRRFEAWVHGLKTDWHKGLKESGRLYPKDAEAQPISAALKDKIVREARAIIHRMAMRQSPPLLTHDPLSHIEAHVRKRDKTIKPIFTVDELRDLVGDGMRTHPFWLPMVLMAYTGRRSQEAIWARWEWFDFKAGMIYMTGHPAIPFKSGEATFPLEPELAAILKPTAKSSGFVVASEDVRYGAIARSCDRDARRVPEYRKAFIDFLEEAKVPRNWATSSRPRTPHSLRHTWISLHLAMGMSTNLVMAYAAHSQESTTLGYGTNRTMLVPSVATWGRRMYLRDAPPKG